MAAENPIYGAHQRGRRGKGHPIMYGNPKVSQHFDDFPDGGGYPHGFIEWAMGIMDCEDHAKILHLCSGSVKSGVRVDIRPEVSPDIVADCRNVPLPDCSQRWVMADPPYSADYAQNLYGTGMAYPKPGQILKEASRLLEIGGRVGLLHFIVPVFRRPLKLLGVYGVTTGWGNAIRAFSVFEKVEPPPATLGEP
jgi:hypothetical protein